MGTLIQIIIIHWRSAAVRRYRQRKLLALFIAVVVVTLHFPATQAQADSLLLYDRYNRPYPDNNKIKSLLGESLFREFEAKMNQEIQACNAKYNPEIERLWVPGYAYHLDAQDARDDCKNNAIRRTTARVPQMMREKGAVGSKTDDVMVVIKPLADAPGWFTCTSGRVCVEYLIEDPADRERFVQQCVNHKLGARCPKDGRRCEQSVEGRKSITYGGNVSNDEFRRACINTRGKYSCYGRFC